MVPFIAVLVCLAVIVGVEIFVNRRNSPSKPTSRHERRLTKQRKKALEQQRMAMVNRITAQPTINDAYRRSLIRAIMEDDTLPRNVALKSGIPESEIDYLNAEWKKVV